jgi:DNA-binding transcriptional MerR regulator
VSASSKSSRSTDRRPDLRPDYRIDGITIDIVAARAGVTVRRVQYLEREGLVKSLDIPSSPRRYNEATVDRIRLIERLMSDLGVNLPGAEVILNMRERMLLLLDELERTRRS